LNTATTTKRIYVETSIFSFLCAEPSMVLVTAARQRDTHSWWNHHRMKYRIFTSSEVLAEAGDGDTAFASKRVELIAGLDQGEAIPADRELGMEFLAQRLIPRKAEVDAVHLAIAIRFKADILLTWNLRHLANPATLPFVYDYLRQSGRHRPIITTPSDLLGSQ
jgi:hypothetical protein